MATRVETPAAIVGVPLVDVEIEILPRLFERTRAAPETIAIGGAQRLRRFLKILVIALLATVVRMSPIFALPEETPRLAAGQHLEIRLRPLPAGVETIRLEPDGEGGHYYVLEMVDGSQERVRPRDLAERLWTENRDRRWYFAILNITSPIGMAWVVLGLFAQVVFMGRMVVQWVASERLGRSVVPVAFWWMSLAGASMLLTYFVWRRDIVGVLGQSAGWIIYSRNLWMIYHYSPGGGSKERIPVR